MKFGFVDEHRNLWPVRVMCAALDLSASGYYAWRSRPESQRSCSNRALLQEIRQIHSESSGTYGSPRIHAALLRRGCRVGRCRIERLMRRAGLRGLAALPRRTRTTDSRHTYPIAPNRLARNLRNASSRSRPTRSRPPISTPMRRPCKTRAFGIGVLSNPRCLVPGFDGALFSPAWRDALWARFFTAAPPRQRRSVERYSVVKRA
jgi:HTH-like domain